jgi:hypothetical protein
MSHLTYTVLFAALISGATGLSGKRTAYTFLSCMGAVVAGSWVMFWIHG